MQATKSQVIDVKKLFSAKGTVESLPNLVRQSPLAPIITDLVKDIPAGDYRKINQDTVKGGTWASVVRKMKKNGLLAPEFYVERRGEEFYFVHRRETKSRKAA